ncbi:MAG: hypothetical protein KGH98_04395 [Candidatus Micrarchaeota archaeon]|nr:hypothetical protein [Candidatus Micrarchaeota archaeon]
MATAQQLTEPIRFYQEANSRSIKSPIMTVKDDDVGRLKIGALRDGLNAILAAQRTKKMYDATILVERSNPGDLLVVLDVQDVRTQGKAIFESEAAALYNIMIKEARKLENAQANDGQKA